MRPSLSDSFSRETSLLPSCRSVLAKPSRRALGPRGPSSGTDMTHPEHREGVTQDDVALLREGAQIDRSSLAQDQVDHSTASVADEMIVLAGLRSHSGRTVSTEW